MRSAVRPLEALRLLWTIGTGFGALRALYLLRQVWLDDSAIRQVRPPRADFLRVHTRGEVWDQAVLTVKIAALFLAGVASLTVDSFWPVIGICVSVALLIYLQEVKLARRRRIFRTLRLNREAR